MIVINDFLIVLVKAQSMMSEIPTTKFIAKALGIIGFATKRLLNICVCEPNVHIISYIIKTTYFINEWLINVAFN